MKLLNYFILIVLFFVLLITGCNNGKDKNNLKPLEEKKENRIPKPDSQKIPHITISKSKSIQDSIEILIRQFLVPNIELMYQAAVVGSMDDNFIKLKNELKNNFRFLSEEDLINWSSFLIRTKTLLAENKSKFELEFWITRLTNGHHFPSVVIYEVLKKEKGKPPVKEMADFWKLDFNNLFPAGTVFTVEFAKDPLVNTYEIWLQKRRQETVLEGMTLSNLNRIILFVKDSDKLTEQQTLIHEFSHLFFRMKTRHLSDFEQQNSELGVEQYFKAGAKVIVPFTYQEFSELMAKLSELIFLPDDKLYHFLLEISKNKMPEYKMTSWLIVSTTVYKYLDDEFPEEFIKLQNRDITDEEVHYYLYQMSQQKTNDGENKLRTYLMYHVNEVSKNLEEVVFK